MRTLKLVLLIVIVLALMLIMTANMAPVDLHLTPKALGLDIFSIPGVPLALVIVGSVIAGVLIGILLEFLREGKYRTRLNSIRGEMSELREQNDQLVSKLGSAADDMTMLSR